MTKNLPRIQFFAYTWWLPAYSSASLLAIMLGSSFAYNWSFFSYSSSLFTFYWSFLLTSGKVCLNSIWTDCKQRSSTASNKTLCIDKLPPSANFGWHLQFCQHLRPPNVVAFKRFFKHLKPPNVVAFKSGCQKRGGVEFMGSSSHDRNAKTRHSCLFVLYFAGQAEGG